MTIQQIADTIDKNNWAFTVSQTEPKFKKLANQIYQVEDTAAFINNLIKKHNPDEIQIQPSRKNGSAFPYDVAKVITINIKKKEMNLDNTQLSSLAGLNGLGLSMSEIFTAKDKALELSELKQKVERLEAENKALENTNRDLGFDLKTERSKNETKNEWVELLKSPQGITLASAIASKLSPVPALGNPAGQDVKHDPKIQYLVNFLELKNTPEVTKDFLNYIVKAHQVENAAEIIKELADTLIKYNIIRQPNL
jgi:hypothetical protein